MGTLAYKRASFPASRKEERETSKGQLPVKRWEGGKEVGRWERKGQPW